MTTTCRTHHVNMTDVDMVQVNFSRFFLWMDDAYDSLLRQLGHPLSSIIADGFATPVVDARCSYLRPVALDDQFTVKSGVIAVGNTSYTVAHQFSTVEGVFAIGRVTHVWITTDGVQTPVTAPEWVRESVDDALAKEYDE